MTLYVFDVDGTLTEPTRRMSDDFAAFFAGWARGKRYFLTSGSTLETMRRQIPPGVMSNAEGWFPCMGNEFWEHGKQVYGRHTGWPLGLFELLLETAAASKFKGGEPPYMQERAGMVCFSTAGRNADATIRARYVAFDARRHEREKIAARLRKKYPDLSVMAGGQTSIDIAPKGMDKGQILRAIRWGSSLPIMFFGDRTEPGGNDYPLLEALRDEGSIVNAAFQVSGPDETRAKLESL